MTRLVIGTHGAVAQALAGGARVASSPARTTVREIVRRDRPTELAIVALPPTIGPLGAIETSELERLLGETLTAAAIREIADEKVHELVAKSALRAINAPR